MKNKNLIFSYLISFLIVFIYSYIFFFSIIAALILGIIGSLKIHTIVLDLFNKNEIKNKRIIFREFLDLLNTNLISGQNLYTSLVASSLEIKEIFFENNYLSKNLDIMLYKIDNGSSIEEALVEFRNDMNLEEASIFVDTLVIGINSGVNISTITNISKDMLTDSIAIELDLSTIIDNSKKEFIIMAILPLIILIILSVTSMTRLSLVDYIVRVPVFILFIFSFSWAYKIVNRGLE